MALKELLDIEDFTLPAAIGAALESRERWLALEKFARKIMLTKERAERERQGVSRPGRRVRPPPDPPPATAGST